MADFHRTAEEYSPRCRSVVRALFIRAFTQEQSGGFKPEEFVPQEVIDRNISELPHLV